MALADPAGTLTTLALTPEPARPSLIMSASRSANVSSLGRPGRLTVIGMPLLRTVPSNFGVLSPESTYDRKSITLSATSLLAPPYSLGVTSSFGGGVAQPAMSTAGAAGNTPHGRTGHAG